MSDENSVLSPQSSSLQETQVVGPIPRFEIPDWRERFGVVAGITGRGSEPGRGFDLGLWTDAPVGEVMKRWGAFRRAEPGFDATILGQQVHQARVVYHQSGSGWLLLDGVDGHVTGTPGLLLTVTVADCVPVFLLDPGRRVVGLLHSGWRGTAAGILERGLRVMAEQTGARSADIVMHCGVAICGKCYEVGSEVMEGCGIPSAGAGPWHVDLRQVLVEQASRLGVRNISTSQWCSCHDRRLFYSHRGSGGLDGRMVAYLGIPSESRRP